MRPHLDDGTIARLDEHAFRKLAAARVVKKPFFNPERKRA